VTAAEPRVALVTGAGRPGGLGATIVGELVAAGTRVIATDIVNELGYPEAGTAKPSQDGYQGEFLPCDLLSADACGELVAQVAERCGRLDILVNNAAAPHGGDRQELDLVPVEAWDIVHNIGLRSPFVLMKHAIPLMRQNHWGRLINIASADGQTGRPRKGAYASSKAGLIALTRSVAMEVGEHGVTANCVCPGPMLTRRATTTAAQRVAMGVAESEEAALAATIERIPVGRYGLPVDIARVVAFLASENAGYVTAAEWGVHGGELYTGFLEV
jgi:3-oxoacyl-[acyl-carrier protein] reductase